MNGSYSVYYLALLEEFTWTHSDGASVASINFLIYALAGPFVGLAFDRFGHRVLMPVGGVLVGTGLLLSGFGNSLWHLYLSYGVVTALGQGALGSWSQCAHFLLVRAAAGNGHGIASMGQGLGALIVVPLTRV